MRYDRELVRCEACGEMAQVTYRGSRPPLRWCRCHATPEEWERELELRKAAAAEKLAQEQAQLKLEAELAAQASRFELAARQRAEDAAIAGECWERSSKVCRRDPRNYFDVCYACPRQSTR